MHSSRQDKIYPSDLTSGNVIYSQLCKWRYIRSAISELQHCEYSLHISPSNAPVRPIRKMAEQFDLNILLHYCED